MPRPEPETITSAQRKIVETAQKMLAGTLSFIEGSRALVGLRFPANLERDKDILPFVAIDSETDAFPFGDVRLHWKPEALSALLPEIERAEEWAQGLGSAHCRNLIERFS